MLILNYIPHGDKGILTPDGEVETTVREWLQRADDTEVTTVIKVGHALPITCLRALVKEGVTSRDDCGIQFNGRDLPVNEDGRIDVWPTGFCDTEDGLLDRLLGWDES